jgi:hypothetical protein
MSSLYQEHFVRLIKSCFDRQMFISDQVSRNQQIEVNHLNVYLF